MRRSTLEFKTTTGTRREAVATVCAMLNQRGGHVLFGVLPDGAAVDQQVSERTLEELGSEIQRIDPPVFPQIERVRLSGGRARSSSSTWVAVPRRPTSIGVPWTLGVWPPCSLLIRALASETVWESGA